METGNVKVTIGTQHNQCSVGVRDFLEHSQNLLSNGEPKVDTGEANVLFGACDGQGLTAASKLREVSANSQVERECS